MIYYKKDTDNIVTITLDMTGRNVNILNHEISRFFLPVLQHLKKEKQANALRGVIITSAKKTFLSGGDLEYIYHAQDASELFSYSQVLHRFFRDLESPGIPVVAAINGTALGTGFELALACHHRIVLKDPSIKLGLPEVTLGMMPGSGGVVRLLWLLGLVRAYPILTNGQQYSPEEALEVGIIDELAADKEEMLERSKRWLLSNTEGRRPWDKEHGRIPGGTANDTELAPMIQLLTAQVAKQTYANYPAPLAILNTLVEGSKLDFDTACRIENRNFTELCLRPESKNMIKALWFDFNAILDGVNRPKGYGKFRPRKVGIIGAGLMGSGIAYTCLLQGLEVVLKDISRAVAERGKEFTDKHLSGLVAQQKINLEEKSRLLNALKTTEDSKDFESCDVVIEAVFENKMVKTKVTREADHHLDEYALFASNTSSIPISDLAAVTSRPQNFVGLRFFPPVEEIPLVEIVKGKDTSDETIARAVDFVKRLRKIPIVVKDTWGFYASRVQNTYILEGIIMLEEGYPPSLIENLGLQAGMPSAPLALADDLSLEMVLRYEKLADEHYGPKYIQHPAVKVLNIMLDELHRPGSKKREGFYDYDRGSARRIWQGLRDHLPETQTTYDRKELTERFLFAQVIEAIWCLQEGIIHSIPEANLGSIYGWGFPRFKGGVLQYVNDYGIQAFYDQCQIYQKKHGPRFKAPSMLRKKAAANEQF